MVYDDFTEKIPPSFGSHTHLSSSLTNITPSNSKRAIKTLIRFTSQINGTLLQVIFQTLTPCWITTTSPTFASFWVDREKSLGNMIHKGSTRIHLSFQKLVVLPLFSFLLTLFVNQFAPTPSSKGIKFLHQREVNLDYLQSSHGAKPLTWSSYVSTNTLFQSGCSSWRRRHFHLTKILKFTNLTSLTPRPSLHLGWQTFLHLTQQTFRPPLTPPQRNSLWIRVTLFVTP